MQPRYCAARYRAALVGVLAGVLAGLALPAPAEGQYFGRNQVKYESFKFEVLQTEHFDVHYYPRERLAAASLPSPTSDSPRKKSAAIPASIVALLVKNERIWRNIARSTRRRVIRHRSDVETSHAVPRAAGSS